MMCITAKFVNVCIHSITFAHVICSACFLTIAHCFLSAFLSISLVSLEWIYVKKYVIYCQTNLLYRYTVHQAIMSNCKLAHSENIALKGWWGAVMMFPTLSERNNGHAVTILWDVSAFFLMLGHGNPTLSTMKGSTSAVSWRLCWQQGFSHISIMCCHTICQTDPFGRLLSVPGSFVSVPCT